MHKMRIQLIVEVDIEGKDSDESFAKLTKSKQILCSLRSDTFKVRDAWTHNMVKEEVSA